MWKNNNRQAGRQAESTEDKPDDKIQCGIVTLHFLVGRPSVHDSIPPGYVGVAGICLETEAHDARHVGCKALHG